MEQHTQGVFCDRSRHCIKHLKSGQLVLNERISLCERLQADTLTQLIHIIDMSHPLAVNGLEQYDTFEFPDCLRLREFCFLCLIQLDCALLECMLEFFCIFIIFRLIRCHRLHRDDRDNDLAEFDNIPFLRRDIIRNTGIYRIFHKIRHHLVNGIAHALTIQYTSTLLIDDLSLVIVDLIVVEQVFTDSEVVALDLHLSLLNGVRQHLVLDLLALGYTQRVKHIHQLF